MVFETFNDYNDKGTSIDREPIWAKNLDDENNERHILEWLKDERDYLAMKNQSRFLEIVENVKDYAAYPKYIMEAERRDHEARPLFNYPRVQFPEQMDLIESVVAKLTKYKPAYAIIPSNDEYEDRISAEAVKSWVDHISYINDFDSKLDPEMKRLAKIMGEAYLFCDFDETAGDYAEGYEDVRDAVEQNEKVELKDEYGRPMLDSQGNPIIVEKPVKTGEIKYFIKYTTDVLVQWVPKWENANYIFWREVTNLHEARALNPGKEEFIRFEPSQIIFDYENQETRNTQRGEVVIWHFFHKRSNVMAGGRYIRFTNHGILKNVRLHKKMEGFPCVRLTDKDIPGALHGVSTMRFTKGVTKTYQRVMNHIVRNNYLFAPKIVVDQNSVKHTQLGNDPGIVEVKGGGFNPYILQSSPTSPEVFKFVEMLKEYAQQKYGLHGVSRGEPPAGIHSSVALTHVSEMENERHNHDMLKAAAFNIDRIKLTMLIASINYANDNKRAIKILGENGSWKSEFVDAADLSKDYDVRVQNVGSMSESLATKRQQILDLEKVKPGTVTPAQFLDAFSLSDDRKYISSQTEALRAADAENEMLLKSKEETPSPEAWEDQVAHWKQHRLKAQSYAFKHTVPHEFQKRLFDHIAGHEFIMIDYAMKYPQFQEVLMTLEGFPMIFDAAKYMEMQGQMQKQAQESVSALQGEMSAIEQEAQNMAGQIQESQGMVQEQSEPIRPEAQETPMVSATQQFQEG